MARSYIGGLTKRLQNLNRYYARHGTTIQQYLDAQGLADYNSCVQCVGTLLADIARLAPAEVQPEQP
jgi:hypothetical protein